MSVGKSIPRVDAEDKLTGKAQYIDDLQFPGQLLARVVRSPHACADIVGITLDEAFDWSQVVTFTTEEIPGENVFNIFNMDAPFLARDHRVNYIGEPVMLLAAPSRDLLEAAERHVRVEYRPRPAALTVDEALELKSLIYGQDNVQRSYEVNKGDIEAGFAQAAHIIEGVYRTGYQEHAYIETQGMIAVPDEDRQGVTLHGSFQCLYYVRKETQRLFTFPAEKIRAVQAVTGGAFGGKEHYPSFLAGYTALLALKCGKPVRMIYERTEDIECSTKRHPSVICHRTGIDAEGRLVAMEVDVTFDGGAYSIASPVVLARGTIAACGAYLCPNVKVRSRVVATNTVPTSAFRGFGGPQAFFAVELHMERVAEAAGLDPYRFRSLNLLREGAVTATGQVLRYSVGSHKTLEAVVQKTAFAQVHRDYQEQPSDAKMRRGIGVCSVFHGAGFTGMGENFIKARAGVGLCPDGSVKVLCGTTEMGQGMRTVLPQMAATALHIPVEDVSVEKSDTSLVPDSGPTVASRTTMIIGQLLTQVAPLVIEALTASVAARAGVAPEAVTYRDGHFHAGASPPVPFAGAARHYLEQGGEAEFLQQYSHPPFIQWNEKEFQGDAYAAYSWASTVAEVEVDTETCQVKVLRLTTAQDVGKVVNPALCEGQVEGGVAQALGMALMEEMKTREGRVQHRNLTTYIIPTTMDVPPIDVLLLEEEYPHGPFGAKGVGELPLVAVAPALAAAIRQATGADVDEIPITPERLFEKMEASRAVAAPAACVAAAAASSGVR